MAELYRLTLGNYLFSVLPDLSVRGEAVVRTNASPNLRVAVDYTFRLRCRLPATSDALATVPPSAATVLGTFLADLHARTLPTTLSIVDSAGTAIPQIGTISTAGGWEDLQIVDHDLPFAADQAGQLLAGAYFSLTFRARRSLADADGVCEFSQVYETDTDETGAEVRRLLTTIRLSLAAYTAGTRITTAAIATQLRLACPVGWSRTRGNNSNGFSARYPLYAKGVQDGLLAETVSEIRTNNGVSGASGATDAEVSTRVKHDPERGLIRTTTVAETTGPLEAVATEWVEAQRPAEGTGETLSEPNKRHARGEWSTVDRLFAAEHPCVTRVTRRYVLRGGTQAAGAIPMSFPVLPFVTRGPLAVTRLVESIEVHAKGPSSLDEVPVPGPLPAPWVLDGEPSDDVLPSVDEHSNYAAQRVWLRAVTRHYLWAGARDPRDNSALRARVMSDAGENLAVVEVT